jgi:sodium/potassium/calcium exchanger 6
VCACACALRLYSWMQYLSLQVGLVPMWGLLAIFSIPLSLIFLAFCPTDRPPKFFGIFVGLGFCTAAIWINIFASELVDLLTAIGKILNISDVMMGATVLAWGGSIGDLTADVMLAKNKREGMAITACYGGPMFNMLIAVGMGVLLYSNPAPLYSNLDTHTLISFCFLISSLTLTVISALSFGKISGESGNRLPGRYAFVLWFTYLFYFISMVVYEVLYA